MYEIYAQNYNFIIVLISTIMLGVSAGLIGTFLVLRKQALISDAVTHATLPGIAIGFMISLSLGLEDGRYLPILLICSAITAYLGAISVHYITKYTRLTQDTAIASTMSFFYGLGLLLFSVIQNIEAGNKAGLDSFLLGQVSGLSSANAMLLSFVSIIVIITTLLNFKSLRLLCFDKDYALIIGMKTKRTEAILLFLMILVVCTGLKTVGLILIIALLIIPPITARLWTEKSYNLIFLSAFLAAIFCSFGVILSKNIPNLPTGSTIVITGFIIFILSIIVKLMREKLYG